MNATETNGSSHAAVVAVPTGFALQGEVLVVTLVFAKSDGNKNPPPLKAIQLEYLKVVLEHAGGNKTLAAEILGIDRRTFYRWTHRAAKEAR